MAIPTRDQLRRKLSSVSLSGEETPLQSSLDTSSTSNTISSASQTTCYPSIQKLQEIVEGAEDLLDDMKITNEFLDNLMKDIPSIPCSSSSAPLLSSLSGPESQSSSSPSLSTLLSPPPTSFSTVDIDSCATHNDSSLAPEFDLKGTIVSASSLSSFLGAKDHPSMIQALPVLDTQDSAVSDVKTRRFTLLHKPGLSLTNSLNKCWFHASLHLLANVPMLREYLAEYPVSSAPLYKDFRKAIQAIIGHFSPSLVSNFFEKISAFNGVNNRYGQIAVPDFLEYLWTQLPDCFKSIWTPSIRKMQCLKCNWVSYKNSQDMLLKVYIPTHIGKNVSLKDLIDYNFINAHSEPSLCGHCHVNTNQKTVWDFIPNLVCLEILRVTERKTKSKQLRWSKNNVSISFPTSGIHLPGSSSSFRVIGTCDHRGTLYGGHWVTRMYCKSNTWYEADDLKNRVTLASTPGVKDTSVVNLLLIADTLF